MLVRRSVAAAGLLLIALAACTPTSDPSSLPSSAPTPRATVPSPPSQDDARRAEGAAALGDDPGTSAAGRPVDTVDWMTPSPEGAGDFNESPDDCHQDGESAELTKCILGDKDGKTVVAVAGDSKTRQWIPALDRAAKTLGWRLVVATKTRCTFTTAPTTDGGVATPYPSCDVWNRKLIARIQREKPDIFITGLYKMRAKLTADETRDQARTAMIEGVHDAIAQVASSGAHVIVFDSTPINNERIPECVEAHAAHLTSCTTPKTKALSADRAWDAASSQRALAGAPGAQLVDMNDYICPGATCVPVIGHILVYRDKHHVTVPYMRTLAPVMTDRLRAASAGF